MPHDSAQDFKWIVLKNDDLGKLLASLTPAGLERLRTDFERTYSVALTIDEFDDELDERDGAWLDVPRFEISFRVQRVRLIRALENLAEAIKTQLAYEIKMHTKSK
ncbi:MAG TPA: hypothetical protein VEU30_12020 [Thermoanaerobaculia bacterium]|nr:hypothetical protein [Thermoanaerobaculia bacterium]